MSKISQTSVYFTILFYYELYKFWKINLFSFPNSPAHISNLVPTSHLYHPQLMQLARTTVS